jgi:hypothetical protein
MMNNSYLCHHGVTGQKWGVRRYQNKDGSLTPEGRKRLFRAGSKRRAKFTNAYEKYLEAKKTSDSSKKFSDNIKTWLTRNVANDQLNNLWYDAKRQAMLHFDGESMIALNRGHDWVDAFMEDYRKYGAD